VSAKAVGVFMLDTLNNLELVEKFCYSGEMLDKSRGAEEASRTKSEVCMVQIQ